MTDIKKSNFVAQSSIPAGAFFDMVINGTNVKISAADMIAAFGTTGSLEQLGEVLGTPVLSKSGTVNRIRNIIGGSGVVASVSPQSGIQLDHNFTVDETGVPILKDKTLTSPILRSLVAGSGINIGLNNGSIQIALSASPASTKTVIVNVLGDFPTPSGGVITLEPDTMYFITNDITTSNRFVTQDTTVLAGADGTLINLVYTGSGTMITTVDASTKIQDVILSCPNGQLIDVSDSTGLTTFEILRCTIGSCDTLGTVQGVFLFRIDGAIFTDIITDGLTFSGNNSIISMFSGIAAVNGGTFIDLGASTSDGISIQTSLLQLGAGTTFLDGAVDSANLNTGGLGSVLNTRILGTGTALNNISPQDNLWQFGFNDGIPDSRDSALINNTGTTIAIAAPSTPVKIDADWVEQEASHFETDATGKLTYKGKGTFITLHASVTAGIVSGADTCTLYFAKNGAVITASGVSRDFSATTLGNLGLLWGLELATDDYIEVFVENNDTTVDFVVDTSIVRID